MIDRHRQQRDDQRLPHDLFALESEQQYEGRQQRDQRDRLQAAQGLRQLRFPALRQQGPAPQLGRDHWHDDVKDDR